MADGSRSIKAKTSRRTSHPQGAIEAAVPKTIGDLGGAALLRHVLKGEKFKFWGLPARGQYSGGGRAGTAAAVAYMKFLRANPYALTGGYLQNIAMDMLSDRSTACGSSASESLRGQAVGFFCEINRVLSEFVQRMPGLDAISYESLVDEIDDGLARTKADDDAELSRGHSAIAREAWKRRKDRLGKAAA
jgi:hypothetical protein